MLENNVLKVDKLSGVLEAYAEKAGQPSNMSEHRPEFKKQLQVFFDHHDEFYTETDLTNGCLSWAYGLKNWMGHADPRTEGKDRNDYLVQYVHPILQDWYRCIVMALTMVFTERKVHYLRSRFTISVPMRDKRGDYHLVKQMAMVFGKDEKKKVVSFINSFTIFGAYLGEPLDLQFFDGKKKVTRKIRDDILSRMAEFLDPCMEIDPDSGFSLTRDDFFVLDIIRDLRSQGRKRTIPAIQKRLEKRKGKRVSESAASKRLERMHDDVKWILRLHDKIPEEYYMGKAKIYLPPFKDVFELADFLDQCSIIYVIRQYLQKRNFPKAKNVKKI